MPRSSHKLAALALLALGAAFPPGAAGSAIPRGSVRISNERTVTRWATPARIGTVRARPDRSARAVGRLRWSTEDGFPEVYVALRRYRRPRGWTWLRVRLPGRPNGRTGWIPGGALEPLRTVRTRLVVDRRSLHAALFRKGRRIWRAPVGVGAHGTPTPGGKFWIREKFRTGNPSGLYGPWAIGTSAYSSLSDWPGGGVVGLHGTNQPALVPGRPSHGCIRLHNRDVKRLVRLMPVGTPLLVR